LKKKIILILSIFTLIACETASVDLDDNTYVFDGRDGVKCDVDGIELKPRVVTSPGPGSSELSFESYMGEDYITLRFNNRDENNAFLAVRMVVKGFNPNVINLEGMTIDLNDYSTGEYSINT
jgi:hypothetical protein